MAIPVQVVSHSLHHAYFMGRYITVHLCLLQVHQFQVSRQPKKAHIARMSVPHIQAKNIAENVAVVVASGNRTRQSLLAISGIYRSKDVRSCSRTEGLTPNYVQLTSSLDIIEKCSLSTIPELHCYLRNDGLRERTFHGLPLTLSKNHAFKRLPKPPYSPYR